MSTQRRPAYNYLAQLARVIDGDTQELDIDLGFRIGIRVTVRLLGIDTPERGQDGAATATAAARHWWEAQPDYRALVWTEKVPEKFGRWLAWVEPTNGGESLNDYLVRSGLAVSYFGGKKSPKGG